MMMWINYDDNNDAPLTIPSLQVLLSRAALISSEAIVCGVTDGDMIISELRTFPGG